jgi:hypothetical protein
MQKTARGFKPGWRRERATAAARRSRREWPLAEAMPLIVFGLTCVALSIYLLVSASHAELGHYALWPYLLTIGAIAAVGGIASMFASWEEEPAAPEVGPNEVVVPRDEYEMLLESVRRERSEAAWDERRESPPLAPRRAPAPVSAQPPAATTTSAATAVPSAAASVFDAPPTAPEPEVAVTTDAPSPAPAATPAAPPSPEPTPPNVTSAPAPPERSTPSDLGTPPEALASFLARLKPIVAASSERASPPSVVPSPPPTPATELAPSGRPEDAPAAPAPEPERPAAAAASSAAPAEIEPAASSGDGEIEHEFDRLLEALSSGGPATAPPEQPVCVSCDKPVSLPYVSCQSCGNPLCGECRAAAAEEGHPRRCPTCALLQRYS